VSADAMAPRAVGTRISAVSQSAGNVPHYGSDAGVHHPFMRENTSPRASEPPTPRRSGMPPLEDVSAAWKRSAVTAPCWPTHRDNIATKPTQPWTSGTGFFYAERLDDRKVEAPVFSPRAARTPTALPTAEHVVTGISCVKGTSPRHLNVAPFGRDVDPNKHPRWLSPRYLNLPTPNEPHLRALPQPWGPQPSGAQVGGVDGIARRWPVMHEA